MCCLIKSYKIKGYLSKQGYRSGLNRRILEQTWGLVKQQLTYKAEWVGRQLISVSSKFTSQKCFSCNVVDKSNRDGKLYSCSSCGLVMDADHNATLNILRSGWTFPGGVMPETCTQGGV